MNILITGGTGFIGSYLVPTLTQAGHQVTILSRSQRKSEDRLLTYLQWTGKEMPQGIGMYDAIINLAGASIGGDKWTDAQKKLIIDSRVDATRACVNYINSSPNPPQVFISASGVGYYGSDVTTPVDESGALGDDFPAKVVKIWEEEANKAECRTVTPRIGVVLETDGGALERMLPLFKMYLGGRFADGKQGFPWVHMQDIVKAFHFFLTNDATSGVYNIVAPDMVDNKAFSKALAKALGTWDAFTVPAFAMKLVLGEQADLVLGGQKVLPKALQAANYQFAFPDLAEALEDLVG